MSSRLARPMAASSHRAVLTPTLHFTFSRGGGLRRFVTLLSADSMNDSVIGMFAIYVTTQ